MGNPAFAHGMHLGFRQAWSVFPIADTAYTPDQNDVASLLEFRSTNPTTLTIPPDDKLDLPVGANFAVMQGGTGAVTIAAGPGVTINRMATFSLILAGRYAFVGITKTAPNVWHVSGHLTQTP